MADLHKNFAYSTILTAPSPATSGTSLVVQSGQGSLFPTPPFNATIWPSASQPTTSNAEIVRVTAISVDTLTITRTQESTSARTVLVGDQIAAGITVKTITDLEMTSVANTFMDISATQQDIILPASTDFMASEVVEVSSLYSLEVPATSTLEVVTATNFKLGASVQVVSALYNSVATGTTQIPNDDTIPQITEGDQYMAVSITPKSKDTILRIDIDAFLSNSNATQVLTGALFRDSGANALAATASFTDASTIIPRPVHLTTFVPSASVASTTFKFRAGPHQATTITFNGVNIARLYGDIPKSSMTITEYVQG